MNKYEMQKLAITIALAVIALALGTTATTTTMQIQHSQTILGVKGKHSHLLQYFPPTM